MARVCGMPFFISKGQRSRSHDVQTSKVWRNIYLWVAALVDQVQQVLSENCNYAIVRPNLLSALEMVDHSGTGETYDCAAASVLCAACNKYIARPLRHFLSERLGSGTDGSIQCRCRYLLLYYCCNMSCA